MISVVVGGISTGLGIVWGGPAVVRLLG
jgi:hypothetical protein